jgi:NitT/TauT family transport system substrate-binding protein
MKQRLFSILILAAILTAMLAGCTSKAAAPAILKIAVIPVLDTLPLYVAQQEGLFTKYNLQVELVPVASGPERDQLIAAGQADGMVNEIVSVMFFNKETPTVQAIRYARAATSGSPLFRILAGKDSGITSPADLKGVPIGISDGTVIAYLTDRLLRAEGLSAEEIQTASVPSITDRVALLSNGQLLAATLPDPLASLTIQQGAIPVLDDTSHPEYSFSVYSFRKVVIDQNPEAMQNFLKAIEEAVTLINSNGNQYRPLMLEQKLLPQPLAETFDVPQFVTAGVPTVEQFADALDWAKGKGLLTVDVKYADCVNAAFLPK